MTTDYNNVWNNCLEIIKANITDEAFKTYFMPIEPICLEDTALTIQVASHFILEHIEEKYLDIVSKALKSELGNSAKLNYRVVMDQTPSGNPTTIKVPSTDAYTENKAISMVVKTVPTPFVIPGLKKLKINSQLNEEYTFDNFIEGDCNRLARSAGLAITQNPGKTPFNPFFIYSKTGLGKSHLSQAIGLEVLKRYPEKTVLYVSAEKFMHQFVDASTGKGNGNQNDFINFYQMIDVLIIDDIQDLSGREKTQDVFFHIFNHLHQNRKQLIFASDRPPIELKGIEDRLISRFKWGLSSELQCPDYETRKRILLSKSYKDGINLPEEVVDYLAQSITTNIRELEGARLSLVAQASFNKLDINIDLARKMIDKFVINTTKEVSIDYIQKVVCDYFSISVEMLNSSKRQRAIVQARQLVMYFAKEYTKSSLANIGNYCGNRDHATVLHALRTVNNLRETDKQFRGYFNDLEKKIKMK